MSTSELSEIELYTEIWRSFASLLKVYAAAASLNGIEHRATDYGTIEEMEDFEVQTADRKLDFAYHIPTKRGFWSVTSKTFDARGNFNFDEHGHFELTADGSLVLDGRTHDLDHGAIELIAKLTTFVGATL